jgi:nitrile hydratase
MNGIHDMGGMHGFGRVAAEPNEPVFHQRWQGRVYGMVQALRRGNIDAGRHSIERLDPVAYLEHGYYGRWLAAFERGLVRLGILAPGDVEARMKTRRRRKPRTTAGRSDRTRVAWTPVATSFAREVGTAPAFAVGDTVATRNHQPAGHTRLPAYARCRTGVIARVHAAMVFPDDNAHGRGENPQYLYTVRFDGRELWGADAEAGTVVHIDLFESYLDRAG